jgi:hypothetical protein
MGNLKSKKVRAGRLSSKPKDGRHYFSIIMNHKKQHYIPESYLKAWCDPKTPEAYEPYIWIISKNGREVKNKAPSNVFHQTDMYTINIEGERDLSIETSLSILESEFSRVRRDTIESREVITPYDRLVLCAFTSAMYSRTLGSKDRWKPFWDEVAQKSRMIAKWSESATPEQRAAIGPMLPVDRNNASVMTIGEIEELAEDPVKSLLPAHLATLPPLLFKIDLVIIETSTAPGFITSDDPCVWFDPELHKREYPRGPALISPSIEIHLPVSPKFCLLFNRRGENGYLQLANYGPTVDSGVVAEANWRTRKKSRDYIVSNQSKVYWDWFVYSQI